MQARSGGKEKYLKKRKGVMNQSHWSQEQNPDQSRSAVLGWMAGLFLAAMEIIIHGAMASPLRSLSEIILFPILPVLVIYGLLGAIAAMVLSLVWRLIFNRYGQYKNPVALMALILSSEAFVFIGLLLNIEMSQAWWHPISLFADGLVVVFSLMVGIGLYAILARLSGQVAVLIGFMFAAGFVSATLAVGRQVYHGAWDGVLLTSPLLVGIILLTILVLAMGPIPVLIWELFTSRQSHPLYHLVGLSGLIAVVVLVLVVIPTSAVVDSSNASVEENRLPNVLFIVMDTARQDHFSCYGYERDTTPNIDRLADEGVLAEQAISNSSGTVISHFGMVTGQIAPSIQFLNSSFETLAEVFKDHGYDTGAVIANPVLERGRGFDQGFDLYVDAPHPALFMSDMFVYELAGKLLPMEKFTTRFDVKRRSAEDVTLTAEAFISQRLDRSFFLFLNYLDPHDPYIPPPEFRDQFASSDVSEEIGYCDRYPTASRRRSYSEVIREVVPSRTPEQWQTLIDLYDGEIAYTDDQIGQLIDQLRQWKILDQTIVVITADHGELFGENGLAFHYVALTDPELRVPLILRYPPSLPSGRRIKEQVQVTDIMPTLLEIIGVPLRTPMDGQSLVQMIRGIPASSGPRDAFSLLFKKVDAAYPRTAARGNLTSIRTPQEKFVWSSVGPEQYEYYDRATDPDEARNLAHAEGSKPKSDILRDRLVDWQGRQEEIDFNKNPGYNTGLERLKQLGYIK